MEKPTRPEPRWTDRLPRAAWLYAAGALLVALTVTLLFKPAPEEISYGELKRLLRPDDMGNRIAEFRGEWVLSPTQVSGELRRPDAAAFIDFVTPRLGIGEDDELIQLLDAAVADGALTYRGEREPSPLQALLPWLLPLAFMFAIFLLMMRRIGPGSAMPFARSRGRMYAQEDVGVTFHDVAGIDEAVDELREVVEFLKCPERYQSLGGRIPKGVLLVGPPGTGKTLLARAVAGEAGVPFFSLSGSDFVEMFVGVGAARVRDLFAQAVAKAPCIIFIDELDALGKSRGGSIVGGHDEREQTLNALLVEMDGFDSNRGVMILAATNRPETLDVALLRPGRFDRQVVVDRPDVKGREAILKVHARNVKLAADVEFRALASLTPGFAGADLANLVNEAALLAARKGKSEVGRAEFEEGIERVIAGLEKRQRVMHPEEKERVAHHECGHALVACSLPNTDPVHKVSIIPRGIGALGYTLQRPTDDRYLITRSELESRIRVLLGGIVAEELVYGETSTGAQNDLERASEIARSMVRDFGMSERLGRVNFRESPRPVFVAGTPDGGRERQYSEETAREIDVEVKRIIDEAVESVRAILGARREALAELARLLMEKEVIDDAELKAVLDRHPLLPHIVPGTEKAATTMAPPVSATAPRAAAQGAVPFAGDAEAAR